jgi:hypothetical protein
MPILVTGNTFATGDSVTATTLNNAVNNATFDAGAVDNATTQLSGGAVIVRDGGITPSKLSNGGPSWTSGGALTAASIESTPIGATTPSSGAFTALSATGTTTVYEMVEKAAISATGLSGTVNYNALDGAVVYVTANATGNWTLNLRGDGSIQFNSMLATGDAFTFVVMATQGATAYYQSGMQIDGTSVTPKWSGGTAPAAGNANSIDVYTFVVIKTASATFTVLASQTKFA